MYMIFWYIVCFERKSASLLSGDTRNFYLESSPRGWRLEVPQYCPETKSPSVEKLKQFADIVCEFWPPKPSKFCTIELHRWCYECSECGCVCRLFHHIVDTDRTGTKILQEMNRLRLPGEVTFMPLNRLDAQETYYPETNVIIPSVLLLVHSVEFCTNYFSCLWLTLSKSLNMEQSPTIAPTQKTHSSSSSSSSSRTSRSRSRTCRLMWHKLNTIASRTLYTNYREKN